MLAHSASHKDKTHHEHNRELASATAESFHDRTGDETKAQTIGSWIRELNANEGFEGERRNPNKLTNVLA